MLNEARETYVFSGYQLRLESPHEKNYIGGGITRYWPKARKVTPSTLFDIGSLTKVVFTTSVMALLVERKRLFLQAPLEKWLHEIRGSWLGQLTIAQCLTHSTGLRSWYPLYLETDKRGLADWFRTHAEKIRASPPQTKTIYSDLGFLLLGLVLEREWGDLKQIFQGFVAKPLGLESTFFGPVKKSSVCATEYCLWRNKLLQGEVFDENCWKLGSVCPHAGLFSTASDLARFCEEWLRALEGKSKWLGKATARIFTRRSALVKGSTWALGWDTKSKNFSSAGDLFSMESFGHLGYTGCSMWVDPENKRFAVFLSNRVHPSRFDERFKRLRPRLHDEAVKYWESL